MRDRSIWGTWNAPRLPLIVRAVTPLATLVVIGTVLATGLYAMSRVREQQLPSQVNMLAAIDLPNPVTQQSLLNRTTPESTSATVPSSELSNAVPTIAPTSPAKRATAATKVGSSPNISTPANSPGLSTKIPRPQAVTTFDGRRIAPVRTMTMIVTAYSPDARSCGDSADGITASGYSVWTNGMKMIAADKRVMDFGDLISVPGYNNNKPVPVLDRGGAIKGNRLDLLMPTHEQAQRWGKRTLRVTVWDYVD